MDKLYLADLNGMSESEIKEHIVNEYAGRESYEGPTEEEKDRLKAELDKYEFLIAYESVGDWGCDSSSYFLMKDKDGNYIEFSGSHCSCYGFEGQYDPQPVTTEYLKSDNFLVYTGGYDGKATENEQLIKDFVRSL
jgi:hypothetical protein